MVAAGLEHVEESDEVALEVGARILDGVADARLGGEVHHDVEAVLREQALDEGGVAQVAAHEGEAAVRVGLGQHAQARVLDAGVVIAVKVVEADDRVIGLLEQLLDEERADETGSPCNQYFSCHVVLFRFQSSMTAKFAYLCSLLWHSCTEPPYKDCPELWNGRALRS